MNLTGGVTLAQARVAQIALLDAACYAAITAGFTSSALGSAYTYGCQNTPQHPNQSNLDAAIAYGRAANDPNFSWKIKCAAGSETPVKRPHNLAQLEQLGADMASWVESNKQRHETIENAILAAASVAAVRAIVWSS